MLAQGYVAVRIGVLEARTFNDPGAAGIVAAVLISRGAGYAFAAGIVLCLLFYGKDFFRNWKIFDRGKDHVFNAQAQPEIDAALQPVAAG